MAIQRNAQRIRARLQDRRRNRRDRVAAQFQLGFGADGKHRAIRCLLIGGVHAAQRGRDDVVYVVDRAHHALAVELRAAVEIKAHLVRADGNAGRAHRNARRAVFADDRRFYAGISPIGINLSCMDRFYQCSRHFNTPQYF